MLFAATAIVANIAAVGVVRALSDETVIGPASERNLKHYLALLAVEAGTPPSPAGIAAVEAATGARVRVESEGGAVVAGDDLPSWRDLEAARASRRFFPERLWLRYDGRLALTYAAGGWRYAFFTPLTHSGFSRAIPFGLAAALLVVLLAAHWAARRLFRPLDELDRAMQKLGDGDLTVAIEKPRVRELASLAEAFNAMGTRIRSLIAARDRLLGDVSHELRSPLARMKLALELMPPSAPREDLQDDVRRLESIVAQLLDGARFDQEGTALTRTRCDLGELIEGAIADARIPANQMELELPKPAPQASVDARWLKVVVRNLIDNALKHAATTGRPPRPVRVALTSDDGHAQIVVQDHGRGIAEADVGRVFDPFFQVDEARTGGGAGVGLGLSLCKKIVQAHRGTITLQSALGQGTTVTVRLPLAP
jgi:signal transduction histidine kinase